MKLSGSKRFADGSGPLSRQEEKSAGIVWGKASWNPASILTTGVAFSDAPLGPPRASHTSPSRKLLSSQNTYHRRPEAELSNAERQTTWLTRSQEKAHFSPIAASYGLLPTQPYLTNNCLSRVQSCFCDSDESSGVWRETRVWDSNTDLLVTSIMHAFLPSARGVDGPAHMRSASQARDRLSLWLGKHNT